MPPACRSPPLAAGWAAVGGRAPPGGGGGREGCGESQMSREAWGSGCVCACARVTAVAAPPLCGSGAGAGVGAGELQLPREGEEPRRPAVAPPRCVCARCGHMAQGGGRGAARGPGAGALWRLLAAVLCKERRGSA